MIILDVRSNVEKIAKRLTKVAEDQLPFAVATALTTLIKDVQTAEKASLPKTFDRPTPFTVNAIRIIPAKKNEWYATVFVMDTAAAYLYPYEVGGRNMLPGRGIAYLEPADRSFLNQYGNFPQRTLERLVGTMNVGKGRPPVGKKVLLGRTGFFIATVKTAKGKVTGVWRSIDKNGKKGRGLKLILKFADAHPARQHLDFAKRAEAIVRANFYRRFWTSLDRAISSANRP